MTVVYSPARGHHCPPNNRHGEWEGHNYDPEGTVRVCPGCGKTWVAYRQKYYPGMRHMLVITLWREEGFFERKKRERKTRPRRASLYSRIKEWVRRPSAEYLMMKRK